MLPSTRQCSLRSARIACEATTTYWTTLTTTTTTRSRSLGHSVHAVAVHVVVVVDFDDFVVTVVRAA